MEISQFTDYSLRTLIYVALQQERLSSVKEIAEAYQISQSHLVKVVHKLGKLGYVETFRGRNGGFRLAQEPAEIRIGDVVRKTENLALLECFPPREGTCCLSGVCELQNVLGRAMAAFMAELDQVTLDDLAVSSKAKVLKRLGLDL